MNWLDTLCCPSCQGKLELQVFQPGGPMAQEGLLLCESCSSWFPITNGIPRLLKVGPLRRDDTAFIDAWKSRKPGSWVSRVANHRTAKEVPATSQAQVQDIFQFKWKRQSQWGIQGSSAAFMEKWIFEKYGWKDLLDYRNSLAPFDVLLDAGCGLGREAIRMATANPKAHVIGLELSSCVDEAKRNADAQGITSILFIQGDLMSPPLKSATIDFIFSEGVLHHTPDTREAFLQLSRLLSPRGEIAFYVYRKKAPLREYADDYVRQQIQGVPLEEAWTKMESLTRLGQSLCGLKVTVNIPEDVEVLGLTRGTNDLQRWIYENLFKCFWNDTMSFQENVLINFDWYLPLYSRRHTESEIRGWLQEADLDCSWEHVENAGITVRAAKSARGNIN